ncbi:hypothetical protein X975_18968, partial [Stegodyphus mimosarum]
MDEDIEFSRIIVGVHVKDVTIDVTYEAKFLFGIKGYAIVAVNCFTVKMDISAQKGGPGMLESSEVLHLGNYKIKQIVGGGASFDSVRNSVIDNVAKISSSKIKDATENRVVKVVNDQLRINDYYPDDYYSS